MASEGQKMGLHTYKCFLGTIVIAVGISGFTVSSALAQDTNVIEEIVVTAQRRTEAVQSIPATVNTLDSTEIRSSNLQNAGDIALRFPNMIYQDNGLVARFNIRGVTLNDTSEGNESPIAIYSDDVYRGFLSASKAALFDLERVEILRGPQGTLYGRNATGGLTHFISREPTDEFEGYGQVQYGRFSQFVFEGAAGGPISDNVRFRLSAKGTTNDGTQENLVDDTRWNRTKERAVRFQLAADVSDQTGVLFSFQTTNVDGSHFGYGHFGILDPQTGEICSIERSLAGACTSQGEFQVADPDPTEVFSEYGPPEKSIDYLGGHIRVKHNFGSVTLTSISAYQDVEKSLQEDADSQPAFIAEGATFMDGESFSQEFRLNGETENWNWVGGVYYYYEDRNAGFIIEPYGAVTNNSNLRTDSIAAYVDVQTNLTGTTRLSAGLRLTQDEKRHTGTFDDFFGFSGNLVSFDTGSKEDRLTGRVVVDWRFADSSLAYASFSTGFKSPAFNTLLATANPNPLQAAPSEPETILAYEVGIKRNILGGRGLLNVSGFFYDYEGIQQTFSPSDTRTPQLANVGDANVFGLEAELALVPAEGWELNASIGLLDNEIESSESMFDGNQLASSPDFSFGLLAAYTYPIGNSGSLRFQAEYRYQSDILFAPDNDPFEAQEGYGLANLFVSWSSQNEKYQIEGFANNVLDEEYLVHSFVFRTFGFMNNGIWGLPRTYGVRAVVNF